MKCLLLLLTITFTSISAFACDICGAANSSGYIGILPEFRKYVIGIRHRYSTLYSHLGPGGEHTYLTTKETYQSLEAWGWLEHK